MRVNPIKIQLYMIHNGAIPEESKRYLIDTFPIQKWGSKEQAMRFTYGQAQRQLTKARQTWLSPRMERVEQEVKGG